MRAPKSVPIVVLYDEEYRLLYGVEFLAVCHNFGLDYLIRKNNAQDANLYIKRIAACPLHFAVHLMRLCREGGANKAKAYKLLMKAGMRLRRI